MIWIDTKYAGMLAMKLERYHVKQSTPFLAAFRCPICGDSARHKYKTRGFLYQKTTRLFYKCHNCGVGMSLGTLIKRLDQPMYDQYRLELYREGAVGGKSVVEDGTLNFKTTMFEEKSILDRLFDRLDTLPATHEAVRYFNSRCLPPEKMSELYYCADSKVIEKLGQKYHDKIKGHDPRLVIPFYDRNGVFCGIQARALADGEGILRYISIQLQGDDKRMIYNIDRVDIGRDIMTVEGPLDSMSLPNAIAVGSSDLTCVDRQVPKQRCILIYDNQPRNKEILALIRNAINAGFRVFIWPEGYEAYKDINDLVRAGITTDKIVDLIRANTYTGLYLRVAFNKWCKRK